MDNEALLRRCRRGDGRAWEIVLERYERLVYSIPLQFGLSRDDAADVAQLTFSALLQSIDRITEPDRLGSWLATVAKRQSIRIVERQRRMAIEGSSAELAVDDGDAQRRIENLEWVNEALLELSPKCRELIVALYFTEPPPPYEALAEQLGVPVGSIGPTRARCLQKMRQVLTDRVESASGE